MIISTLVSLFVTRELITYVGIENFGLSSVLAYLGIVYILKGTLKTLNRFVTIGISDESLRDNWYSYFIYSVYIAILVSILVIISGIALVSLVFDNIAPMREYGVYIVIFISIEIAVAIVETPLLARVIGKEKFSVYAQIGIIELIWKPIFIFVIIANQFPPIITYGFFYLLNTLIPVLVLAYNIFSEERFKFVTIEKKEGLLLLGHMNWNFWSQLSFVLFERASLVYLSIYFGPTVLGTHDLSKRLNNYILKLSSNAQTVINPRIMAKSSLLSHADDKVKILMNGILISLLVIHLAAVPAVVFSENILGFMFPGINVVLA